MASCYSTGKRFKNDYILHLIRTQTDQFLIKISDLKTFWSSHVWPLNSITIGWSPKFKICQLCKALFQLRKFSVFVTLLGPLAIAAIAEMCLWHTIVSVSTAQLLDKSTRYRHDFVIFAQRSIASQAGFSFIESSRFSFEWANILRQVVQKYHQRWG